MKTFRQPFRALRADKRASLLESCRERDESPEAKEIRAAIKWNAARLKSRSEKFARLRAYLVAARSSPNVTINGNPSPETAKAICEMVRLAASPNEKAETRSL